MTRLTCFTPTYNRKNTLHRVYESLLNQSYKDFEWLIIDDGSTDNTKELIDEYMRDGKIKIRYFYQKNSGKHVAINNAIKKTNTELFIIADSDDSFKNDSFEILVNAWDSIDNKDEFNGVICRVFEHDTNMPTGEFPQKRFVSDSIEACFYKKIRFENWQLFSTKSLRDFPFPEIDGLHFFPETVIWQKMASKYKTLYIDDMLREYYRDQGNSLVNTKKNKSKENFYLWEYYVNNFSILFLFTHFFEAFIKSYLGMIMDSLEQNYKIKDIVMLPNKVPKRILLFCLLPIGYFLHLYKYSK